MLKATDSVVIFRPRHQKKVTINEGKNEDSNKNQKNTEAEKKKQQQQKEEQLNNLLVDQQEEQGKQQRSSFLNRLKLQKGIKKVRLLNQFQGQQAPPDGKTLEQKLYKLGEISEGTLKSMKVVKDDGGVLDGRVDDMQGVVNLALKSMKDFLWRIQQREQRKLDRKLRDLQIRQQELKDFEYKLENEKSLLDLIENLELYQGFAAYLDMNRMHLERKIALEQIVHENLTKLIKKMYKGLHKKSVHNLKMTQQITVLQSKIQEFEGKQMKKNEEMKKLFSDTEQKYYTKPYLDKVQKVEDEIRKLELICGSMKEPRLVTRHLFHYHHQSKLPWCRRHFLDEFQEDQQKRMRKVLIEQMEKLEKENMQISTILNNQEEEGDLNLHMLQEDSNRSQLNNSNQTNNNKVNESANTIQLNGDEELKQEILEHQNNNENNNIHTNESFINDDDIQQQQQEGQEQEKNKFKFKQIFEESDLEREYRELQQELNNQKQKNAERKSMIINQTSQFFQYHQLFNECVAAERKRMEKLQSLALQKDGLNGSYLFEIQKQNKDLNHIQNSAFALNKNKKTNLMGRQMNNLMHDTLKGMVLKKYKQEQDQLDQNSLQLDWSIFEQYTPVQILGLMSLKPKSFEQLSKLMELKGIRIQQQLTKNKLIQKGSIQMPKKIDRFQEFLEGQTIYEKDRRIKEKKIEDKYCIHKSISSKEFMAVSMNTSILKPKLLNYGNNSLSFSNQKSGAGGKGQNLTQMIRNNSVSYLQSDEKDIYTKSKLRFL